MKGERRTFTASAAVIAIAALAACTADATRPIQPSIHTALVAEGVTDRQAQQGEWARRVALALADPALRQRVKNDMRDSPMPEFKLDFSSYLRGPSGSRILTRLAQRENATEAAALQELASMPPLEFYMPVVEHRKSWRGAGSHRRHPGRRHRRPDRVGHQRAESRPESQRAARHSSARPRPGGNQLQRAPSTKGPRPAGEPKPGNDPGPHNDFH
jgi:hypothetical protein